MNKQEKNNYMKKYYFNNIKYREATKLRAKKQRDNKRFGGNREKAIQRDGEKCLNCGIGRQEHRLKYGVDISVDHIDGRGRYSKNPNNNVDNLQTLCLSCHGKKDVKNTNAKLVKEDVTDIRMFSRSGLRPFQIKKCYQMLEKSTIERVVSGATWKGVH